MSKNLDQINKLIKDYHVILLSKRRALSVSIELGIQRKRLPELAKIMKKEYNDLLSLEYLSLKQLFTTILKSKNEQILKERQEYLLASIKYKECKNLITLLEFELGILQSKTKGEEFVIKDIDHKLNNIDPKILSDESILYEDFKILNTDLKNLIQIKIEVKEALIVSLNLKEHFLDMIGFLNKAKRYDNWGEFYKEKQEGKIKKKAYIDKAQANIYVIKKLLLFLKNELIDVEVFQKYFRRSQALLHGFNIEYYSDLITDWIEDSNLSETLTTTLDANTTIIKLIRSLEKLEKDSESEYVLLEKKRETLIEKLTQ